MPARKAAAASSTAKNTTTISNGSSYSANMNSSNYFGTNNTVFTSRDKYLST